MTKLKPMLMILLICMLSYSSSTGDELPADDIRYDSIPEGETTKGDITKGNSTATYWILPNGSVDIYRSIEYSDYGSLVFNQDGYAVVTVDPINLDVGENYTIIWKHYASAEMIDNGTFDISVTEEGRGNNSMQFNINISNTIQVHAVNVSISDSNGTLMDWNWGQRLVWYDWDWVKESTDLKKSEKIDASDGDEISLEFEFEDLKPGQEYNVSWKVYDNNPSDYPMILDNGFEIVTSEDGTYVGEVSFDYDEGTHPCVEYTIGIEDHRGQTFRRCISVSGEDSFFGLPWISGMFNLVAIFAALIVYARKK